ncbi:acyltransferase family protein, partial [Citrobacter portucalensis]|uniref:acyltransferase family protein n=1 Tax=Citrobacter portucalensis TaxID=1639133 RepID=UPI00226B0A25
MIKYRYDIGALRAIAVISVVMYHFGITGFSGGYSGVDVFFVISGFLMTKIIFSGIEKNSFSIISFYLSRARRIIPALVFVCLSVSFFGWFNLTSIEYKVLAKHALSSMLFLSNFVYMNESNYFDASSGDKWLLHTWSLSVEWQFYLLYPIIILSFIRLMGVKKTKASMIIIGLLSLTLCLIPFKANAESSFYMLPWRSWEMLAGGCLAIFTLHVNKLSSRKFLSYLGVFLILSSVLFIDSSHSWPSVLTLIPVSGAMLVMVSCYDDTLLFKSRVVQYIAKISYSIYLWHWPVIVLLKYYGYFGGITATIISFFMIAILSI